tara:strand:- start:385 stop:894 length:510 start_codon:yes stop_codon:yes gene_type:complete
MNEYIIIANGPDRTGIVSDISQILTDNGGNITKSRMTKLAGDFVIIMLVQITAQKSLIEKKLSNLDLIISIKNATQVNIKSKKYIQKKLLLNGTDNEGIVFSVTDFLAKYDINIKNLTTEIQQAPITGINLFYMEATLNIPQNISIKLLQENVTSLKKNLEIDIELMDI